MQGEALTWIELKAPTTPPQPPAAPPSATMEKLELVLASGVTVRLPAHFDDVALRRLLAVLS
jgi:hypothetical protein